MGFLCSPVVKLQIACIIADPAGADATNLLQGGIAETIIVLAKPLQYNMNPNK